jgi:protein-S-isoprenylcysteine O-methyltransferase Ste14
MLVSQHLHSVIAGTIAAIVFASEVSSADKKLIEKFGEPYKIYKEQVPGLNFIVGIIRIIKKPEN